MHSQRLGNYFVNLALSFPANKEKKETPFITVLLFKSAGEEISFLKEENLIMHWLLRHRNYCWGGADTSRSYIGKEL